MGLPKQPKPVATDNTAASSIVNVKGGGGASIAIDMRIYYVCTRIQQNDFHIL